MSGGWSLLLGVAVLAGGTYVLRIVGPMMRARVQVSGSTEAIMDRAAVVLLVVVALTGAVYAGQEFAGWARPAGVAVGVVAALCKAPLALVIILAAATAAGLRAVGIA